MNEEKVNKCLWDDYRMNAKERWCAGNLVKGRAKTLDKYGTLQGPGHSNILSVPIRERA